MRRQQTATEINPADNSASHTADQTFTAITVAAPRTVENSHCTGTALTSYYECVLFPSSISSHTVTFEPGGVISFGALGANYGGTWSVNGTELVFGYTDGGSPIGTFVGQGTTASCWEGRMSFVPEGNYTSMYKVCLV